MHCGCLSYCCTIICIVYLHMHFLQLTCHWIHEPTGASSGDDSGTADLRSRQQASSSTRPFKSSWSTWGEGEAGLPEAARAHRRFHPHQWGKETEVFLVCCPTTIIYLMMSLHRKILQQANRGNSQVLWNYTDRNIEGQIANNLICFLSYMHVSGMLALHEQANSICK